ncbi:MAG: hypothetical protein FWC55_01005 [Firmicutes bacterium]|nr:hypothetical protein [Bacillota bacterium]
MSETGAPNAQASAVRPKKPLPAFDRRLLFPMNAAELMDRVFDVYKVSFWPQVGISLLMGIITSMILFVGAIILSIAGGVIGVAAYQLSGGVSAGIILGVSVGVPFAFLAAYYVALTNSGGMILARQAYYQERPSVDSAFGGAMRSSFRVSLAVLAQIAALIPIIALCVFLLYQWLNPTGFFTSGFWLNMSVYNMNPTAFALSVIGLVIAVGFAAMLATNPFACAVACALYEKRVFFGALARSVRLVRGDFWRIFGVRLLGWVVVSVISYSVTAVFSLTVSAINLVSKSALPDSSGVVPAVAMIEIVVSLVMSVLLGPISKILNSLIYFNQRVKKEGLDLEIGIEKMMSDLPKQ